MTARGFLRTPFASRLLRHAMRDRARRETGSPGSSTSPMFDDWREGIHGWVRHRTADLVDEAGIRLHDYIAAVNSSMAFGFNLFMPFREHSASALEDLLTRALGFPIRVVDIEFEFQWPTDVLAECAGPQPTDDEKFTASDVAVHVEDDRGRAGLVLVEVKLGEGGFTPCNGARSAANRRKDVCASAATFFDDPRTCYLRRTRHARRDAGTGTSSMRPSGASEPRFPGFTGERCPFEGDHQQLMRNHALALGLVQAGEVAFTAFGLVHHPDNHHVVAPWEHYHSLVADPLPLFRIPANELVYAAHLDTMIKRACRYAGPEEDVELRLLERNDSTAAVCCFDRQIQVPGIRRRLDLIGFLVGEVPALVAIEVKRYRDPRIQDVSRQLHEYLEILDPTQEGLRDDVARSYRTVCEQLRTLGLSAPDPTRITAGMPVKGLVIVSDYNPRSRLLPRAHELAAKLERPMYLWQPTGGQFVIPGPERWVRMGLG